MNELALFAGAGGGILGGKLLGWRTVCAVEWEPYPASVLCARQNDGILPPFPIWDDVRTFDGKPWRGIVQVVSDSSPHYADIANSAWQCAEFMMNERQKRIDLAALNEKRNNSDMRTLKLSSRLHYALLSEDLYTIADICCYTEKEILKIPNIGRTQLAHLKAALATVGESLAVQSEK